MSSQIAIQCLRNGLCLELTYKGFSRLVEVHAVGVTKDGNEVMRVWQVRGGSQSGEQTGWKLMRLDEAGSPAESKEKSKAPRNGYARGDGAMATIYAQL